MNLPARLDRIDRRASARPPGPPVSLDSPAAVLALLETAAGAALTDREAEPLERARTLAALASVALKALEARDLAARVEALERVLKQRKERR